MGLTHQPSKSQRNAVPQVKLGAFHPGQVQIPTEEARLLLA